MQFQENLAASTIYPSLPSGPIHADLFRNKVMFNGEQLSGFFDFYFAGCDRWLFDVAVTVNDWCIDLDSGATDAARVRALLDAYHAVRPFTVEESSAWPAMLRAAALRFWISRLYDFYLPREAEMLLAQEVNKFAALAILGREQAIPRPTGGVGSRLRRLHVAVRAGLGGQHSHCRSLCLLPRRCSVGCSHSCVAARRFLPCVQGAQVCKATVRS
jgi:homoserine kinase type II